MKRFELVLSVALAPVLVWGGLAWASGEAGVARVGDGEVGVLVDHWTGSARTLETPGLRPFVPWLQQVLVLDKRPLEFRFHGNAKEGPHRVPQLVVRANDGSSFWFDDFKLSYALLGGQASRVLVDSGPGDAYQQQLVNAFARSILRDEFGRFSAEDVVAPANLLTARSRVRARLNERLHLHGLDVLDVATAKPRFDKAYEQAIERRKVGNQLVQSLQVQTEKLEQERIQRRAKVNKEKESQLRVLEGDLARNRLVAEQEVIRVRRDADIYYLQKTEEGRVARARKESEAAALTARYEMEAEGLAARAAALAAQGEEAVRAALIERLASIEFFLMPYRRDPAPERVEHTEPPAALKP